MKKYIIFLLMILTFALAIQATALELLVLSGDNSKNSKRWKEEVFPDYGTKNVGKTLPATIVPIQGRSFPDWLTQAIQEDRVGEVFGTPTFIIWDKDNRKEMGRLEGYTQKPRFFSQLDEALTMIEKGLTPGQREGSKGHMPEEGSGGQQSDPNKSMSRDIMDHIYKTPEEAKRVSEKLGFGGEIHTHQTPTGTIYMPGPTM